MLSLKKKLVNLIRCLQYSEKLLFLQSCKIKKSLEAILISQYQQIEKCPDLSLKSSSALQNSLDLFMDF